MMSGRWLRIAPLDSSTPLQTMSYCQARMSSGSLVSSASIPPCGIEKGLWLKSIFFWSSLYSNIGKSTIQQKRNASFSIRSRLSATRVRAAPASLAASASLAGGEEDAVVGTEAQLRRRSCPCPRCRGSWRSARPIRRPCGSHSRARRSPRRAPSRSSRRRTCGSSRRCPARGRREPPCPCRPARRTGRSPTRRNAIPTSWISNGLRRSGLSLPYFSIASL